MNTLNHDSTSAVNPLTLKPKLLSTYLLIRDLAKRRGYCYAGNQALAAMLGVSVDTVTRRVKALAAFGLLSVEQEPGLRRLLFVSKLPKKFVRFAETPNDSTICAKKATDKQAVPPAPAPSPVVVSPRTNMGGSINNVGTCPQHYAGEYSGRATRPAVADAALSPVASIAQELAAVGISSAAAAALVQQNAEECRRQLLEFKRRQAAGQARGPGWLVKAIREGWRYEKAAVKESYPLAIVERPKEVERPGVLDRAALAKGLGSYVRLRGSACG